jgi:hypothetical protein
MKGKTRLRSSTISKKNPCQIVEFFALREGVTRGCDQTCEQRRENVRSVCPR